MQVSMLTVIIIAVVALLIGWAIGFADSNRNSSKKIQAAENKAEIAIKEAEHKVADAEARVAAAAAIQTHDDPGLLRLKDQDGRLTLEMDGRRINAPSLTAEEKRRLIGLLTLIRPWLDGQPAQEPAARAGRFAAAQTPPMPLSSQQAAPTPPASAATEPKTEPKEPATALSIVAQIDSILQARILNTPLAKQAIRLQQSPEGGVIVWVGIKKYPSLDDVPDPDVKSAIRAAIAEWEQKYTPG